MCRRFESCQGDHRYEVHVSPEPMSDGEARPVDCAAAGIASQSEVIWLSGTVLRRPWSGWRGERAMTSTVPVIRWGIIGAGDIADRVMAPAMRAAPHAELVAIMRRDRLAAAAFARRHDVPRVYGSVENIVADPDIQAIYVATPVARHLPDTLAAAAQGKHILCEKPMALNFARG